jgi:ADP-L-glycero-D-manno-heptose 6-epimerase
LRVSNPYGPTQLANQAQGAVGVFLSRILNNQPIEIWGDGTVIRDYLYIDDLTRAVNHLIDYQGSESVFNIGSGVARSWLDLAHALFAALNLKPVIEFIEMPDSIAKQYQYYTCSDITRVRATGYQEPLVSLEEAIEDYVCNYLLTGKHLGE